MSDLNSRLSAAARALAAEAAQFSAPESVERALRAALESRFRARRRRIAYAALGGAIAASLAVAAWTRHSPAPVAEAPSEQPFVAIPYSLPLEPWERAEVRRVDMPVSALIAAGFPMSMMDPGAHAQADVLVGQDGRARAIRLVSISRVN